MDSNLTTMAPKLKTTSMLGLCWYGNLMIGLGHINTCILTGHICMHVHSIYNNLLSFVSCVSYVCVLSFFSVCIKILLILILIN